MEQTVVLDIAREGLTVGIMVSLPLLAVILFIGLLVSVFQAVTQVQEMTLTFVPKVVGAAVVMVLFGNWMLTTLVAFMHLCFEHAARLGQ